MQSPQAPSIYEFGDFELDSQRRLLVSRATGRPVDITGRVLDALIFLVERPGQLVEKKALIEALWPHVVVEDGNLTQTIHTLRRVLGEKAGEHRYIATVAGRGYRFVAELKPVGPLLEPRAQAEPDDWARTLVPVPPMEVAVPMDVPTPPRPPGLYWWGIAAAVILALAGLLSWLGRKPAASAAAPAAATAPAAETPRSIAVLPFVDMSASQDQMHFAEGLSEEILNLLAQTDDLRVIARTSSFSFKDQNADIHTIAQRLSVTHVLEGSVRKSGERVRITAQLIDAATSAHVWSDTFDRDVTDIFGVQREIAAAVADALHVTLRRPVATRAETRSAEAYEHYLQGRHLFNRRSGSDLLQAKSHFEEAVKIDPEYGRAWAALAGVYLVARYENTDLPDAMRNWGFAVQRATALSPELAEAHYRAAQYFWHSEDLKTGNAHIARARALDPQHPLLLGMSLSQGLDEGRIDDVIATQRKLVAADPLSATNRGNFGGYLMLAGKYEEAQRELERSLELSPAMTDTMGSISDVLLLQGRPAEALAVASRMPEGPARDQRLALAHFARGDAATGDKMLARLLDRTTKPDYDFEVAVAIAEVHAARKNALGAFQWLEAARSRAEAQHGAMAAWLFYDDFLASPFLNPLRSDPRWKALRPPYVYDK